jgi:UPF0271 protein
MERLILNCDLGENEALSRTEQLLALVDAANIACGYHAGSPDKTRQTIALARDAGVRIGAHPGLPVAGGRGLALPTPQEFRALLDLQIGSFIASASALGTQTEYIKLHGSLYHVVESQPIFAQIFLGFLQQQTPKLAVFALSGGKFAALAEAAGIQVWHEMFVDRAYLDDGTLSPRSAPGAVLTAGDALARFQTWREQGTLPTTSGTSIRLRADTCCVHGDSADALQMLQKLRESYS